MIQNQGPDLGSPETDMRNRLKGVGHNIFGGGGGDWERKLLLGTCKSVLWSLNFKDT